MIDLQDIRQAADSISLDSLVEQAATERNCELDSSSSYAESAEWFEEEAPKSGNGEAAMLELAEILRAAEKRWFEIEGEQS